MTKAIPRMLRQSIIFLSGLLTLFLIWLFGFILEDIGDMEGPDLAAFEAEVVPEELQEQTTALLEEIQKTDSEIKRQKEIQETLGRSMQNAGQTMEKLAELQRMNLERGVQPDEDERAALARARTRFLDAQDEFEGANISIAELNGARHQATGEKEALERILDEKKRPAWEAFREARESHRIKMGGLKLLFIVPILLAAAWTWGRRKENLLRPIFLACLLASFWKVGVVMFEHFPEEYFKYIAIGAAILIVLAFLVRLLRSASSPDPEILLKRRREAYQKGHCPVCAYPWSSPEEGGPKGESSCPSCGTRLFESCRDCGGRKHSLLPHCVHCGTTAAASA